LMWEQKIPLINIVNEVNASLEKFGVLEFPESHNLVLKLREFRRQIRFVLRESS
jgi:hypothetical protein